MDAVERRLQFLEDEVKKLRRRTRVVENDGDANLYKPIVARNIDSTFTWLLGYKGEQYETNVDYLGDEPYVFGEVAVTDIPDATFTIEAYSGKTSYGKASVDINADDTTPQIVFTTENSSAANGTATVYPTNFALNIPVALLATGSDPSSPADGWIFYRTDTDVVRLRANGAWVNLATTDDLSGYTRVYYKDNNGTSGRGPAATTSETSLGSFTVTGGDMGTTGILRVRLLGTSSGAGATRTVRIRIKFGGTTIYDDTSVTYATTLPWYSEIHVANVGDAAIQRTGGFILIGAPTATAGSGDLGTDEIISTTPIYATSAINTASDQTFEVTAQLSSGTSPNSFICLSMVAELL